MTASHGYSTYRDLIQSYDLSDLKRIENKEPEYRRNSVMGFLKNHGDFHIFSYLLKIAKIDITTDQVQFNSTIFVCNDEILKNRYGEELFMNLDRNSSIKILNSHILPRIVGKKTLLSRRLTILDTKDDRSQLSVINNNGNLSIATNCTQLNFMSDEIKLDNGTLYVLDGLFFPPNFVM